MRISMYVDHFNEFEYVSTLTEQKMKQCYSFRIYISQIFRLINLPDVPCLEECTSHTTVYIINKDILPPPENSWSLYVHYLSYHNYLKSETTSTIRTFTCIERSVEHCVCGPYSLANACCPLPAVALRAHVHCSPL